MPSDPVTNRTDFATGVILLIFGGIVVWAVHGYPPPVFEPLGPAFLPRVLGWILIGLAAILLSKSALLMIRGTTEVDFERSDEGSWPKRPGIAVSGVALTVFYVLILGWTPVGFVGSTSAFLFILGWLLSGFRVRAVPGLLIFALFLSLGLRFVFTEIVLVDLP